MGKFTHVQVIAMIANADSPKVDDLRVKCLTGKARKFFTDDQAQKIRDATDQRRLEIREARETLTARAEMPVSAEHHALVGRRVEVAFRFGALPHEVIWRPGTITRVSTFEWLRVYMMVSDVRATVSVDGGGVHYVLPDHIGKPGDERAYCRFAGPTRIEEAT